MGRGLNHTLKTCKKTTQWEGCMAQLKFRNSIPSQFCLKTSLLHLAILSMLQLSIWFSSERENHIANWLHWPLVFRSQLPPLYAAGFSRNRSRIIADFINGCFRSVASPASALSESVTFREYRGRFTADSAGMWAAREEPVKNLKKHSCSEEVSENADVSDPWVIGLAWLLRTIGITAALLCLLSNAAAPCSKIFFHFLQQTRDHCWGNLKCTSIYVALFSATNVTILLHSIMERPLQWVFICRGITITSQSKIGDNSRSEFTP